MNIFLKSIFRPLWRQKLFSLLNIEGLTISIRACCIIYRTVSYEFSYDKLLPDKEHTYIKNTPIRLLPILIQQIGKIQKWEVWLLRSIRE